jgi:hypothetical protein
MAKIPMLHPLRSWRLGEKTVFDFMISTFCFPSFCFDPFVSICGSISGFRSQVSDFCLQNSHFDL